MKMIFFFLKQRKTIKGGDVGAYGIVVLSFFFEATFP